MKKLNLLDQSTSFKVNDTGTVIPFNAFENNQPFGVTENETLIFRIKNDMGFLKAVNATSAAGGYIFQLNTKDLVGLVPGTYEIELVVTDAETNGELIFPDNGFCSFNITTSALTVTGTQIPTMSLDSFKQQLEQYVQIQADNKTQQIKNDFSTYVESVKEGPQGEPGPAGAPGSDGKAATVTVGKTTTVASGEQASVTNSGTDSEAVFNFAIPQGPQGEQGPQGATGAQGPKGDTGVQGLMGPQGPQGTIGDYVQSTGWQDLTPYMDTSTVYVSGSIWRAQYCVETVNGETTFKWRIHARVQDSSKIGTWGGIKLFDATEIVSSYGGWEEGQYSASNSDLSHGSCFAVSTKNSSGKYWVENRGNYIASSSSQTGQGSIFSEGIVFLG